MLIRKEDTRLSAMHSPLSQIFDYIIHNSYLNHTGVKNKKQGVPVWLCPPSQHNNKSNVCCYHHQSHQRHSHVVKKTKNFCTTNQFVVITTREDDVDVSDKSTNTILEQQTLHEKINNIRTKVSADIEAKILLVLQ